MLIGCFIVGFVLIIGLYFWLPYFIPLRKREAGFGYVYVHDDGSVRELDEEEIAYLQTKFSPADGARPYVKDFYHQLTPGGKRSGFILRRRVPKNIKIATCQQLFEGRTVSWIFTAIAMASETEPADFNTISLVADGINHAVPSHQEMQRAVSWLIQKGLVDKVGSRFTLAQEGKVLFSAASAESASIQQIWCNLGQKLINYN